MTTITLNHIHKRFEGTIALTDVSLKVHEGEVVGVVGPSGCGKSTLLRVAAGLIAPDSGEVLYDSTPLVEIPMADRGIGMVFQEGALIPHWETRRTVAFHLWLRKRQDEVPARVARISQITGIGLDTLLDRRPRELSGGERQRISVARALARDPRVFLFDEPFSNIDAKLRGQARVELRRLLNEFPVTSIYVTHDQHEAIALSSRIAVMDAGRIVQVGTYEQLYASPVSQFVAEFIGTPPINILQGHTQNGQWIGRTFSGFSLRHDLLDGAAVNLGVRPGAIQAVDDESGENAVVLDVTPYIADHHQLVEVEGNRETWMLTVPLEREIRRGDILRCLIDPAALLFFDAATGQRIG